jgi:hypothetical protein
MASFIERGYIKHCKNQSDINEHLPTLYKYASECSHITECGVRNAVSSYAFAYALSKKENSKHVLIDICGCESLNLFLDECEFENLNAIFYEESDLICPIEKTDLLFIDTWHVYGHLKRELARWNRYVSKYIILHDTTIDGELGESLRDPNNHDIEKEAKDTGLTEEEVRKGLWPAVEEFITEHPEWKIKKRYTNNNGLTILERSR